MLDGAKQFGVPRGIFGVDGGLTFRRYRLGHPYEVVAVRVPGAVTDVEGDRPILRSAPKVHAVALEIAWQEQINQASPGKLGTGKLDRHRRGKHHVLAMSPGMAGSSPPGPIHRRNPTLTGAKVPCGNRATPL